MVICLKRSFAFSTIKRLNVINRIIPFFSGFVRFSLAKGTYWQVNFTQLAQDITSLKMNRKRFQVIGETIRNSSLSKEVKLIILMEFRVKVQSFLVLIILNILNKATLVDLSTIVGLGNKRTTKDSA